MTPVDIGKSSDFPKGKFRVLAVGGIEIGVVRTSRGFFAVRNICPHEGAPVCRGRLSGTMLPSAPGQLRYGLGGIVLRCPWHGWEFRLDNGQAVFGTARGRVRTYKIELIGGRVQLHLKPALGAVSTPPLPESRR
ncbi:MAG TPA: Rieske (2Fe-2S) protein [Candidatus Saccharimonadales bacterium]|nr:Rieske (2Fe-2S) protein [Candidatus Saccharimonadales bacterium]